MFKFVQKLYKYIFIYNICTFPETIINEYLKVN